MKKNVDLGILVLRISVGGLMLLHGVAKLMGGIGPIQQMIAGAGLPSFFGYGVYVGEVIAPLFILAGYATRAASAVFAFNCLVAILMVHTAQIFTLGSEGGWAIELIGLYLFGAIALLFTGGGKYALSSKYLWD